MSWTSGVALSLTLLAALLSGPQPSPLAEHRDRPFGLSRDPREVILRVDWSPSGGDRSRSYRLMGDGWLDTIISGLDGSVLESVATRLSEAEVQDLMAIVVGSRLAEADAGAIRAAMFPEASRLPDGRRVYRVVDHHASMTVEAHFESYPWESGSPTRADFSLSLPDPLSYRERFPEIRPLVGMAELDDRLRELAQSRGDAARELQPR